MSLVWYGFVDDTDLLFSSEREADLITAAQDGLILWESCLRATSGAINAWETFWYGIGFVWEGEEWRYKAHDEMSGDLNIRNFDDTIVIITRVAPYSVRETLGTFLPLTDHMGPQLDKLKAKARNIADCICTGRISRQDAEHGMGCVHRSGKHSNIHWRLRHLVKLHGTI